MAEAEDVYKVGIEYQGGAAVNSFGTDMDKVQLSVQEMLAGLGNLGVDQNLLRRNAQRAVNTLNTELNRAMASAQNHGGAQLPANLGSRFAMAAGIPERNNRQFATMASAAERYAQSIIRAATTTTNAFGQRTQMDPLRPFREGIVQADLQTGRLSRSISELQAKQVALSRVRTPLEKDVNTLSRANLQPETKQILARSWSASVAPEIARVTPPRPAPQLDSDAFRLDVARALAAPRSDAERAMGATWPRQRAQDVAGSFGFENTQQLNAFARANQDVVVAAREEVRARQAAIAALHAEQRARATVQPGRYYQGGGRTGAAWDFSLDPSAADRQNFAFGSYQANMPASLRATSQAIREGQRLALDDFSKSLPRGESVRLGSASAGRMQQAYAFGSYRENIEYSRLLRQAGADTPVLNGLVRSGDSVRLGSTRAARMEQQYNYGGYRENIAAARAARRVPFRESFMTGWGSSDEKPFGQMVGQTARISLFYGVAYRALSTLQQVLSETVTETLAYEDALTNLNLVTNRSRESSAALASTLTDIAASAGFTSSQGVELGARAVGLYGVASADAATQERAIEVSAQVATRMARVSGGDPIATQTQLAGALRSLGWGIERLPELEDTISYLSRQTGQSPAELLGAFSNVQTLASQGGFTPQQTAAILAQVATTTGQNPEATAGQFRQLFSRGADTIAPRASEITGVDMTGMDLQQIFATVSQLNLSANQLNQFASLFGKGGSQQVATILTQQYGAVQGLVTGAEGAQGFGQDAFDRVMESIGNRLRVLGSTAAEFSVNLVETGILDWFALVVVAAQNLVDIGNNVLELFNSLPRPLRAVALALGEVYAAALIAQRMGWTTAGAHAAEGLARPWTRAATRVLAAPGQIWRGLNEPMTRAGAVQLRGQIGEALRGVLAAGGPLKLPAGQVQSGVLGRVPGLGRLTGLGTLGAVGLAAAGVYGVGTAIGNTMRGDTLVQEARNASLAADTAEGMREAAAQARNVASELRNMGTSGLQTGDVAGLLPALINQFTERTSIAEADRLADFNSRRADALEQAQALATAPASRFFQGDFSAEGLASGLERMTEAGLSAQQQIDALSGVFEAVATNASLARDVVAVIGPDQRDYFTQRVAVAASTGLEQAGQATEDWRAGQVWAARTDRLGNVSIPGYIQGLFEGKEFERSRNEFSLTTEDQERLNQFLTERVGADLQSFLDDGVVDDYESSQIVSRALGSVGDVADMSKVDPTSKKALETFIASNIRNLLREFSPEVIAQDVGGLLELSTGLIDQEAETRGALGGSKSGVANYRLGELRALRQRAVAAANGKDGGLTEQDVAEIRKFDVLIAQATTAAVDARLQDAERLANLQIARLSPGDVSSRLAIQRGLVEQQLAAADQQIATATRAAAAEASSGGTWTPVDTSARTEALTARANLEREEQANTLAIRQGQRTTSVGANNALGQSAVAIDNARDALSQETVGEASYYSALASYRQAQFSYSQALVQNQNAAALSRVDPRDTIARLQTQVANARREARLVPANQRGALMDQINQLNQQIAEAAVSQANAADSANIAGNRSQLAQAEVAIRSAHRNLGIQLPGTEAYYSALASLRSAQAELAQAELTQQDRLRRLGSDLTDPVAQARLAVQQARAQLAADQASGQGSDVIAQSQLDLRSAQNQEEAAAFSQRISDLQTAEDLGRISHSAYMSYLQSEHDRLTAIGARTRQQQEQLDQVDKLMKSAAEQLQGQFNIGDIDLPTVYEVRRAIGSNAATQVSDYSNSNNVVNVNGADFGAVVQWLTQYLGTGAQVVTAATPRRV